MHAFEKRGGNLVPFKKLEFINNFMLRTGLREANLIGNKFTCKPRKYINIQCNLDRILIN